MHKNSEDKAERVLSLYSRLKQGKVIFKEQESVRYCVAPRTIQRDISDIQCFLQNQNVESGEMQEIVYDKNAKGYILRTKCKRKLDAKEVLATVKILLESRALMKNELFPIIYKLLDLCGDDSEIKVIEELLKNEMYHYVEVSHNQMLLDRLWELEQAVKNRKYVEIEYKRLKNQEWVMRKVKPVGVMFSEFYFYLTAYIEDINKEEHFKNPDDPYPTIYRIDRLKKVRVLDEHFSIPYAERFEEGEFRKRVQFMYGGKLRKLKLKCTEQSLEAVLDRVMTAEVVGKEGESYIIRAETLGDGIDMWIRGQEDIQIQEN